MQAMTWIRRLRGRNADLGTVVSGSTSFIGLHSFDDVSERPPMVCPVALRAADGDALGVKLLERCADMASGPRFKRRFRLHQTSMQPLAICSKLNHSCPLDVLAESAPQNGLHSARPWQCISTWRLAISALCWLAAPTWAQVAVPVPNPARTAAEAGAGTSSWGGARLMANEPPSIAPPAA